MDKVYLETSFISYLVARPSRDLVIAANQSVSLEWWNVRRSAYDLYVSQIVRDEAAAGDPLESQKRLQLIKGIATLELTSTAKAIASDILSGGLLPEKCVVDALHVFNRRRAQNGFSRHVELQTSR